MQTSQRAELPSFRFRIAAFQEGQAVDLTVAEAGVLLTAVNRSVNGLVAESGKVSPLPTTVERATPAFEPDLVQLVMHDSRHGSLEVQAVIDVLNAVGLDPATAKSILAGLVGSAIWDPSKTKRIAKDFGRAVRRIARGARRRTYSLTFWVQDRRKSFTARLNQDDRVVVDESNDDGAA